MTKTYLITGGTGLVGKAFIESLSTRCATIMVLTRDANKARYLLGNHITAIEKLSLYHVEQADVILNLAGEPIADKRWSESQKSVICQSRWGITRQLVELIKS